MFAFVFLWSIVFAAEEKIVKYQLLTKNVTMDKAPTDISTITNESFSLIQIPNSASYGTANPDYGILSVTIKSFYSSSSSNSSSSSSSSNSSSSTNSSSSSNSTSSNRKKRQTTTTPTLTKALYTNLLLVNKNQQPVGLVQSINATTIKSFECPTSNASTVSAASSSFVFLGYLSSSFESTVDVAVNIDFTILRMGNSITSTLDLSQSSVIHMFEVSADQISYRKSIEIVVTSGDMINATLTISPDCPATLADTFTGPERATLSFSKFGAVSLHDSSFLKLRARRYFVHVKLADDPAVGSKNVTVHMKDGYDYTVFVPLSLYCLVCLFFASVITWGFFRVFSYCCDLPCYASWRRTMMSWMIRGPKGYAYWTFVVGVCIFLGEMTTVYKAYDRMKTEGDRDICFYNEKCYRIITSMDIPMNSVTSNLAFLLHGVMCLIVVSLMESKCGENNHIHEHAFSLAYSLGIAHVFQSLCGGLYSVCPSRLSQTYDLTFLYITLALYVACLFDRGSINYVKDQKLSRFCSIPTKPVRASKFFAFLVGPMLTLQYIESAFYTRGWPSDNWKIVFFVVFYFWLVMVHAWIAFKIELFPMDFYRWLTDGRCDPDHPEFCNWWDCYSYKMKRDSGYGWKMLLFVIHTLTSVAFAAYEGFICDDCLFSYFFLGWLLLGLIFALLFCLFDQINLENKFAHSSWHTNFTWVRVIYSMVVIAAWACSIYVYREYDLSSPLKTPQQSRIMNKECIFFDYYDGNDMFSLMTSFAMLGTTYLVMYLNYPCVECVSSHYGIEYSGKRFSMSMTDAPHKSSGGSGSSKGGCGTSACGHAGCGSKCSAGGAGHGRLSCGCNGSCGCAKKSCGCSIKSICDCKQREASKRSNCKGGCPHTNFSRHDSLRHTKDSGMTDATGISDDISYINVSDDVPDPQIIFKDHEKSKYPHVVVKSHDTNHKPAYLY